MFCEVGHLLSHAQKSPLHCLDISPLLTFAPHVVYLLLCKRNPVPSLRRAGGVVIQKEMLHSIENVNCVWFSLPLQNTLVPEEWRKFKKANKLHRKEANRQLGGQKCKVEQIFLFVGNKFKRITNTFF